MAKNRIFRPKSFIVFKSYLNSAKMLLETNSKKSHDFCRQTCVLCGGFMFESNSFPFHLLISVGIFTIRDKKSLFTLFVIPGVIEVSALL